MENKLPWLESIDQFRGLAIVLMVLANYLAGVYWIPSWLKHAPDIGLTVIDLIAPFFIFAIGLTYGLSIRRRAGRQGWTGAAGHVVLRYLAILGIGALLSAGESAFDLQISGGQWGVLQAIGVAGLAALVFIRFPAWARLLAGLALLAVYQFLLDGFWLKAVLGAPHGGLQGSLSWAAMLILATALADLFHQKTWEGRAFSLAALLMLGLGLLLTGLAPISKNRVSASYVLVSVGASGLMFACFGLLVDRLRMRLPLFSEWGRNPLLLYILHLLLLGIVVLPGDPAWYNDAPAWLVGLQVLGLLGVLSGIAVLLARKKSVFSL